MTTELFTLDELFVKNGEKFPFSAQAYTYPTQKNTGLKILIVGKGANGKYSSMHDKKRRGIWKTDHRFWKAI